MPGPTFDGPALNDREFTVRGKVFHRIDLSPEDVFADDDAPVNGDSPWDITDKQIMKHLPESEHEQWRELRKDKENPVTIKNLNDLYAWLWEEATGVPLPRPDLSGTGAGTTATTSTGKSRSRAGTQGS